MSQRFIDQFDVILLDMGHTFLFDVDRFSADEDFGGTYRALGGETLSDDEVRGIITGIFNTLMADYRNPARYDSFPRLREYVDGHPAAAGLAKHERDLLERTFAAHECGRIPESHAAALHELRATHRLGLVSNIWAESEVFLQEFDRAGVQGLFDVTIFSSEHGCIKPATRLFELALEGLGASPAKAVHVGDSLKRDVAGAKAAGCAAVLINGHAEALDPAYPEPDLVIRDLPELPAGRQWRPQ